MSFVVAHMDGNVQFVENIDTSNCEWSPICQILVNDRLVFVVITYNMKGQIVENLFMSRNGWPRMYGNVVFRAYVFDAECDPHVQACGPIFERFKAQIQERIRIRGACIRTLITP